MQLPASTPDLSPLAREGVTGLLAVIVFWFYRLDRAASERRFQESERRIADLHETCEARLEAMSHDFRTIVQQNTAASTKLGDVIERLLDRRGL